MRKNRFEKMMNKLYVKVVCLVMTSIIVNLVSCKNKAENTNDVQNKLVFNINEQTLKIDCQSGTCDDQTIFITYDDSSNELLFYSKTILFSFGDNQISTDLLRMKFDFDMDHLVNQTQNKNIEILTLSIQAFVNTFENDQL